MKENPSENSFLKLQVTCPLKQKFRNLRKTFHLNLIIRKWYNVITNEAIAGVLWAVIPSAWFPAVVDLPNASSPYQKL